MTAAHSYFNNTMAQSIPVFTVQQQSVPVFIVQRQ